MNSYPRDRAGKFFALKFCKLLSTTAAANEIGPDAVVLLMEVALKEDSKEYTDAPNYWNHQLMPLCGIGSESRLVKARTNAIDAGWLHYEKGGKGKVAKYWVTVPERFRCLWGRRSQSDLPFQNGSQNDDQNANDGICTSKTEVKTGVKRKCNRGSSIPEPKPKPNGKQFSYPDDFEAFWKAFPAGRKTGKKKAFAAWKKATVDTETQTIIDAAAEYAASDVGQGEYVKGPEPWLNGGCWDDDRTAWKDKASTKPKSQYKELGK